VIVDINDHVVPPTFKVQFDAYTQKSYSGLNLESLDNVDPDLSALFRLGNFASHSDFLFALTHRKLTDQFSDALLSYNAARIQIEPYQFKPLLKLMQSPHRRLLIADEVGLGKTIEAGIILAEYQQRERMERVVVLCPNALLHKWRDEMHAKFGLGFEIWTPLQLRDWLEDATRRGEAAPARFIVSLEAARNSKTIELLTLSPASIDMLIVDEAHHLRNDGTMSYELGEALLAASSIALFLTATPLNLRNRDLYNLVHLLLPDVYASYESFESEIVPNQWLNRTIRLLRAGAPNEEIRETVGKLLLGDFGNAFARSERFVGMIARLMEPVPLETEERVMLQRLCMDMNTLDCVLTRTKKSDVATFSIREAHSVKLSFSEPEQVFYDAVTSFCYERYAVTGGTGFGATTYQRQLCSCIPAMSALLDERHDPEELEGFDDYAIEVDETTAQRSLTPAEFILLERARYASNEIGDVDTKFRYFDELVTKLMSESGVKRILVFSFFRRTIAYLESRLKARYSVGVIMGGVPLEERGQIVDRFRDGTIEILIASEVGGEGLDFQFCNVLINYDLPWNPMRVEQRIGRLDRFGQTYEKILIYNLLVDGTVEERIFGRLYERIGLFDAAIGDLDAILGDSVSALTQIAMDVTLSDQQKADRAEKEALQLIHRRELEAEFERGKGALLSGDQVLLDRFGSMQRGKSYLTSDEMANYCTVALKRYFPESTLKQYGTRWSFRPDTKFASYVRQTVYGAGSDGRLRMGSHVIGPLHRISSAAEDAGAIEVTFQSQAAFSDRSVELLSPLHPVVEALKKRASADHFGAECVSGIRLLTSSVCPPGRYALVLFLIESTGVQALRRIDGILSSLETESVALVSAEWLGLTLASMQGGSSGRFSFAAEIGDLALRRAEQCVCDLLNSERTNVVNRQQDLIQMRIESLKLSFERKLQRLAQTRAKVTNAGIRTIYTRRIEEARAHFEHQVAELSAQQQISVGYERIAVLYVEAVLESA